MILDPGFNLTLRPMKYPHFYEHYKNAIKNTWTVEEISFSTDISDIRDKLSPAEQHIIKRLVAFFATGDTIVSNNACLTLYKHVNSPEARMYYGRQIAEEILHVDFYATLLDNYLPNERDRYDAFDAINTIPSIKKKADFCFKWMDGMNSIDACDTMEKKRIFLKNLIAFAACVEGLFFFGAFAYIYFLRSKGLLHGLASGTNWVFRDESLHMNFAFDVIDTIVKEYPELWDEDLQEQIIEMITEAIDCEYQFAEDVLQIGVAGLSKEDMKTYLQYCGNQRLLRLGIPPIWKANNPFSFMELQDLSSHTNFFERTTTEYSIGNLRGGTVKLDNDDF